jgi:hypothetical protein
MDCPQCGLINPNTAQRCDCGFDFQCKEMRDPYLKAQPNCRAGKFDRLRFGLGCLICYFYALARYPKEGPISAEILGGMTVAFTIACVVAYLWKGRLVPRNWKEVSLVFVGISVLLFCSALILVKSNL